jgi:hypothetical protein
MPLPTPTPVDAELADPPVQPQMAVLVGIELPPVIAELVPRAIHNPLLRLIRGTAWCIEWVFGVGALIVGLAILATIPVLQLLSLGYLLEVSGRIARTGRLSRGFVGIRKAARVGGIAFCTWVLLLPLRWMSDVLAESRLIDPGSEATRKWTIALVVVTILIVTHIVAACLHGGRLRDFLWPGPIRTLRKLFRPGAYATARDAVWDFVFGLRLPYYFWLGLRGFVGGLLWLGPPVSLLALGRTVPIAGLLGGAWLLAVVLHLPFLQAQFAASGRFGQMFNILDVWRAYPRAPVTFLFALAVTLLMALPLYATKVELYPREAAWLPSLFFVVFIFPARLASGWAYARAGRRDQRRHLLFVLPSAALMAPVVLFYVLVVYLSQYFSWYGIWSLYEQHSFLVPVPFLGM